MAELARNDGQVGVFDDVEDVIIGASKKAGNSLAQGVANIKSSIEKGASDAVNAVKNAGSAALGVDASSDTTFTGDASTAGGIGGYAERQARAEIAKKQQSPNLFMRFIDKEVLLLGVEQSSSVKTYGDYGG